MARAETAAPSRRLRLPGVLPSARGLAIHMYPAMRAGLEASVSAGDGWAPSAKLLRGRSWSPRDWGDRASLRD